MSKYHILSEFECQNRISNVHPQVFYTFCDIMLSNMIAFTRFTNCLPLTDTGIIGHVISNCVTTLDHVKALTSKSPVGPKTLHACHFLR